MKKFLYAIGVLLFIFSCTPNEKLAKTYMDPDIKSYDHFIGFLDQNDCKLFGTKVEFQDTSYENEAILKTLSLIARGYGDFKEISERELRKYFEDEEETSNIESAVEVALITPDEEDPLKWSIVVEIPSLGDSFGCHVEFSESVFNEIWAGS